MRCERQESLLYLWFWIQRGGGRANQYPSFCPARSRFQTPDCHGLEEWRFVLGKDISMVHCCNHMGWPCSQQWARSWVSGKRLLQGQRGKDICLHCFKSWFVGHRSFGEFRGQAVISQAKGIDILAHKEARQKQKKRDYPNQHFLAVVLHNWLAMCYWGLCEHFGGESVPIEYNDCWSGG